MPLPQRFPIVKPPKYDFVHGKENAVWSRIFFFSVGVRIDHLVATLTVARESVGQVPVMRSGIQEKELVLQYPCSWKLQLGPHGTRI